MGKIIPLIPQAGMKSLLPMEGVLLPLSWAESPALLPGKSSPSCGQLKDVEGQDISWLFPSWPSIRPQGCLAQCFGVVKSWRSSAISCSYGQSSLWRPLCHTQNLLEFPRNAHLILPQTSVRIMLKATKILRNKLAAAQEPNFSLAWLLLSSPNLRW